MCETTTVTAAFPPSTYAQLIEDALLLTICNFYLYCITVCLHLYSMCTILIQLKLSVVQCWGIPLIEK